MSTWVEYITAVVIASFVAITLFSVQLRSQDVSYDSTQYRAMKTTVLNAIQMLEADMKNIGSRHPGSASASTFLLPAGATFGIRDRPDTTGTPRSFEFYAQPAPGQPPSLIRYEWEPVGTVSLASDTVDVYNFRRLVDGRPDGEVRDALTHLSFTLLEEAGNTITDVENTRQIYVELGAISPLGPGRTIEETRWSTVFRPPGLAIQP